jgi:hypothetical protein
MGWLNSLWQQFGLAGSSKLGHVAVPPQAPNTDSVSEIWQKNWIALNQLLAHGTLAVAIMLMIFGLRFLNHAFAPPLGMMLLDPPPFRVPFDWALTMAHLGVISRFVWTGFKLFTRL